MPILFLEPYPRAPRARPFDQHGAAADMNLRKVAVDERLDLCEHQGHANFPRCPTFRLTSNFLSFGTLTRPFYAPTRHRNEDIVMHQMIRLAIAAVLAVAFCLPIRYCDRTTRQTD